MSSHRHPSGDTRAAPTFGCYEQGRGNVSETQLSIAGGVCPKAELLGPTETPRNCLGPRGAASRGGGRTRFPARSAAPSPTRVALWASVIVLNGARHQCYIFKIL